MKKFYLARVVNGPLRMNKGLMPHMLKDRWNNSENPRMKGQCVSNGCKECFVQVSLISITQPKEGSRTQKYLGRCQLFPNSLTARAPGPQRPTASPGWAGRAEAHRASPPSVCPLPVPLAGLSRL